MNLPQLIAQAEQHAVQEIKQAIDEKRLMDIVVCCYRRYGCPQIKMSDGVYVDYRNPVPSRVSHGYCPTHYHLLKEDFDSTRRR